MICRKPPNVHHPVRRQRRPLGAVSSFSSSSQSSLPVPGNHLATVGTHPARWRRPGVAAACGPRGASLLDGAVFEDNQDRRVAKWFLAIYLVTSSKGGIAVTELQRQMGFGSY